MTSAQCLGCKTVRKRGNHWAWVTAGRTP